MRKPVKAIVEFARRRKRLVGATFIVCLAGGLALWQWHRLRQSRDDEAVETLLADIARDADRIVRATKSLPAEKDLATHTDYDKQHRDIRHSLQLTIEHLAAFAVRSESIRWARRRKQDELTRAMLDHGLRAHFALEAFDDRLKLLAALIELQSRDGAAGQPILVRFQIDPKAKPGEQPYFEVTLASSVSGLRKDRPKDFDAYWIGKRARLIGQVTRIEQAGEKWNVYLDGLDYKDVRMEFEPNQVVSEGGIPLARGTSLCIEGACTRPDADMVVFAGCRVVEGYRNWSAGLDAIEWWVAERNAGRRPDNSPLGRAAVKKQ